MLKKLEIDALKADLSAVDAMLTSFTEDDDPIGWYQFSARKEEITRALDQIVSRPVTHAELGVFFGDVQSKAPAVLMLTLRARLSRIYRRLSQSVTLAVSLADSPNADRCRVATRHKCS